VILQRTGSCPMNAITLDFLQETVIPNLFKVLFKVNTPLCIKDWNQIYTKGINVQNNTKLNEKTYNLNKSYTPMNLKPIILISSPPDFHTAIHIQILYTGSPQIQHNQHYNH
jgi:hypothetical protein